MDLLLAAGALLFVGSQVYLTETAPQKRIKDNKQVHKNVEVSEGATEKQDLKLGPRSDLKKREDALSEMAQDHHLFPGHSRAQRPFRREILKQREEVEMDNSDPLVQNVRQTDKLRHRLSKEKYGQIKKTDFLDHFGQLPESFSTGVEAPGQIARSERMAEIKQENRQAIANRALLPKTRKSDEAFPGKIISVSAIPSQKIGVSKSTGPEETTFRAERQRSRATAQSQLPREGQKPELVDKAHRDRLVQDIRVEGLRPLTLEQQQRGFEGVNSKPRRSDIYLAGRRPTLQNASQRQDDPIRGPESFGDGIKRKGDQSMLEMKARTYANPGVNERPFNREDSSRDNRQILNPDLIPRPTSLYRQIHRPKDLQESGRGGIKKLVENRDPQAQAGKLIIPSRHLDEATTVRSGRREIFSLPPTIPEDAEP